MDDPQDVDGDKDNSHNEYVENLYESDVMSNKFTKEMQDSQHDSQERLDKNQCSKLPISVRTPRIKKMSLKLLESLETADSNEIYDTTAPNKRIRTKKEKNTSHRRKPKDGLTTKTGHNQLSDSDTENKNEKCQMVKHVRFWDEDSQSHSSTSDKRHKKTKE